MQEVFEKIIEELRRAEAEAEKEMMKADSYEEATAWGGRYDGYGNAVDIVKEVVERYSNGWIPCCKEMPPVETEVLILAKRKYKCGDCRYIRTTAMYEDGTVSENDSCWHWEDIDGDLDEENDCYIIPEGWWENRHYNPDEVYNNAIDDEVIAWQPLPEPYKQEGE